MSVSFSNMVLYLINPMKHRRERPVCRSGGNITAPGPNHRRRSVGGGFGTTHRSFPTVDHVNRWEQPVCRSGGNVAAPGPNHRRRSVGVGFGTTHRSFPTVDHVH